MSTISSNLKTLFTNCKIWNPDGIHAGSIGVSGNTIDFAGKHTADKNYKNKINLNSKLVLPAFTDGHLHLVYGSLMMTRIDCSDVKSTGELKSTVQDYIKKHPEKEWLIGGNLDIYSVFKDYDKRIIKYYLDSIASGKPLYIANYDYHSGVCNSAAIKAAGLEKQLRVFSHDEIPRDSEDKPSGILKERATNFIFESIPSPTLEEKTGAVEQMIEALHSYGITSVSDITNPANFEVYKKLYEQNKLNIRINSYLPFDEFANLEKYENEINRNSERLAGNQRF